MNPRQLAERLITLKQATRHSLTADQRDARQIYADDLAITTTLLRHSTPAATSQLIDTLITEIAAARDAQHADQARRRRLA